MAVIIVDCPVFFNTAKESKVMNKIHECFCGHKSIEPYSHYRHCQSCKIYNDYKSKYLTYENFYQLYMVERKFYKEFLYEFPYNKFCLKDIESLKKICNFPRLFQTKTNKRFTRKEIDDILNYDYLYDRYIVKNMNASEICEELNYGFDHSAVLIRLTELNIPKKTKDEIYKSDKFRRKLSKALSSEQVQRKLKQTYLDRFGVDNPLKNNDIKKKVRSTCIKHFGVPVPCMSEIVKNKMRNTCIEKYGVDNAFKSKEIQEKFKRTCNERYGTDWPFQNKDIQEKATIKSSLNNSGFSKLSVSLFNKLCLLFPDICNDFRYATHGNEVCEWDNLNFKSFFLDFSYNKNDVKFDIEFNGDYFHANPKLYKPTDTIKLEGTNKIVSDIWKYDEYRTSFLEKLGYKIHIVWEYDYIHNQESIINECYEFIKHCLGT